MSRFPRQDLPIRTLRNLESGRPKPPPQRGQTGGPPRAETVPARGGSRRSPRRIAPPCTASRQGSHAAPRAMGRLPGRDSETLPLSRSRRPRARRRRACSTPPRAWGGRTSRRAHSVVRLGKAAESMQLQRFLPHCRKLFARPARRHHRVVLPRQIVMGATLRTRLRTSVRFVRRRRARAALPTEVSQVGSRPRRACGPDRRPFHSLARSETRQARTARADAPGQSARTCRYAFDASTILPSRSSACARLKRTFGIIGPFADRELEMRYCDREFAAQRRERSRRRQRADMVTIPRQHVRGERCPPAARSPFVERRLARRQ